MAMSVTVRLAQPDEAEALTDLSLRSKQSNGYDQDFMDACRAELTVTEDDVREGLYWVAEQDGLCGCVSLVADPDKAAGEIHAFFVDPDRQRSGIGRALWQTALDRAGALGLNELKLDADPNAVDFYRKLGFTVVGSSPSGSIPGRSIPHMVLKLS